VWPKYLGGAINGVRVELNAAYHQEITNAFRDLRGYGLERVTRQEAIEIMRQVYGAYSIGPFPPIR
jgi:hypothetical protein